MHQPTIKSNFAKQKLNSIKKKFKLQQKYEEVARAIRDVTEEAIIDDRFDSGLAKLKGEIANSYSFSLCCDL